MAKNKQKFIFEGELCYYLDINSKELRKNNLIFKANTDKIHPLRKKLEPVYLLSPEELNNYLKYAKILKTGINQKQLLELIELSNTSNNLIELYYCLSKETPDGLTAHIMRSYCIIFIYQNRFNKMLLAQDLSEIANIDYNTAKRHLAKLQHPDVNYLKLVQSPLHWEFNFVPTSLNKYYK